MRWNRVDRWDIVDRELDEIELRELNEIKLTVIDEIELTES